MRLLLFNPDTEYALATGASFYTPPARVAELARELQLLPEAWAREDDIILVEDRTQAESVFRTADWGMLREIYSCGSLPTPEPWGWNHAVRRRLLDSGVPESVLPAVEYIDLVRNLAHRRTSIKLNEEWNATTGEEWKVDLPVELTDEEECVAFYRNNPGCWMKAPWSSSGRGVVNTGADMEERHVRPWCRGILRRQGSVICETPADRAGDFATEWRIEDGEATYLGLSKFITSNRGKYISNSMASQERLEYEFCDECAFPLEDLRRIQKEILEETLRGYTGLLGVDMIVEKYGKLRPFVEINLRRTMGMLCLPRVP